MVAARKISRVRSFGREGTLFRVGKDEQAIREYIQKQEKEDRRLDQLGLFE